MSIYQILFWTTNPKPTPFPFFTSYLRRFGETTTNSLFVRTRRIYLGFSDGLIGPK